MAKGNNFGGFGGLGGMMQKVQKMQKDMKALEESLQDVRVTGTSGGGMVTATVDGHAQLLDIKINPEVVDPEDIEMLQDLVVSAVRDAGDKAQKEHGEKMQELTGGVDIPNIPGLF